VGRDLVKEVTIDKPYCYCEKGKYRVVDSDRELSKARLALCEAVRIVLRDGLTILGISTPEKM
jgi:arginyl-tRNA synthetase